MAASVGPTHRAYTWVEGSERSLAYTAQVTMSSRFTISKPNSSMPDAKGANCTPSSVGNKNAPVTSGNSIW